MLSDFHFLRPLWLLALIPLAGLLWRLLRADGEGEAWRGVVDRHLLPSLLSEAGDAARRSPLLLLGLAWLLIVLALAGPTWERLPEPLYQARQFRVIALDLSPTMNATDLAPSRLARARYEVLDLLHHSEGQTALLAYGAEPYVVSPLTGDVQTIAAQVPLLETGLLPVAGDRRADLVLERAGELLRQAEAPDGQVILVTDTLDHPAAAIEAARRLRSAGYRVSVLGMGTDKGGPVAGPDGGFVKDSQGAIRIAKLDLAALRELADAGGGRYVTSGPDDRDIEALTPRRLGAPDAQSEASPAQADRWREEGPWLLLVLLPLAALAFRRGWLAPLLLLICLVPPPDAYALGWGDLWLSPDQRATRMLQNGQPEQAAQLFERPDWRAAAHYQANDYAQTLQSLEALEGPSADYNRGNALARMDRLEEALKAYDRALGADPGDADARHNRDLVQRVLDQRRQQQQAAQRAQQQKDNPDQQDQQQSGESQQAQQQQGEEQKDQQQSGDSQQAQQSEQAQQDQSGGQGEQTEQASQQANAEDSAQGQPSQQQAGQDAAGGQQQAQDGKGQDSTTRASAGQEEQQQRTAGQDAGGTNAGSQQADAQGGADQGDTQRDTAAQGEQDQSAPESKLVQQQAQQAAGGPPGQEQDQQQGEQQSTAESGASKDASIPHADAPEMARQQPSEAPGQDAQDRQHGTQPQGQDAQQQGAQKDPGDAAGSRHDATAQSQSPSRTGPDRPDAGRHAHNPQAPGLADLLGDQDGSKAGSASGQPVAGMDPEDRQAIEQMLRRVEDDPGGLLRQRFLLQHLRRTGQL